jgi:CubicO group peptidase (beta-lactamase class C family)
LEFAREHLGKPLGFTLAPWPKDPQGIYFGGNDMEMTARQMLTFGELYINQGRLNETQVVPAEWVRKSLQQHAISTRERGRYYGYGWWLKKMAGHDVSYAWGYGGQYIVLVPDLKLVVVTTSSSTPHQERRSHRRELTDLIEEDIVRVVSEKRS